MGGRTNHLVVAVQGGSHGGIAVLLGGRGLAIRPTVDRASGSNFVALSCLLPQGLDANDYPVHFIPSKAR